MRFITRAEARERFVNKRVAIVGSGPGVLENDPGFVDSHDIVVRVNNYRLSHAAGFRNDVQYSFWGSSCRKTAEELKRDGVWLCMCKLPAADLADKSEENPYPLASDWHRRSGKMIGLNYKAHYRRRKGFWFCDTYVPTVDEFLRTFRLLGNHMPTTGFAAIYDILSFWPASVYLTGFDGFRSRIHNVDQPWAPKNLDDPYRHEPERELTWIGNEVARLRNYHLPVTVDPALKRALEQKVAA